MCPDCDGPSPLAPLKRGDGLCSKCHGERKDAEQDDCEKCDGTGQCQRCLGSGQLPGGDKLGRTV